MYLHVHYYAGNIHYKGHLKRGADPAADAGLTQLTNAGMPDYPASGSAWYTRMEKMLMPYTVRSRNKGTPVRYQNATVPD